MENRDLRNEVLRAYERGRWRHALSQAWFSLGVGAFALLLFGPHLEILIFGAAAVALSIGLSWLHDDFKDGARLGAGLGVVQLLAALYMFYIGMPHFPAWCEQTCFGIVTLGSGTLGYMYAKKFAKVSSIAAARGALAMISIGVCLSVVGCLPGDTGLILGGLTGAALAAPPALIIHRRRYA